MLIFGKYASWTSFFQNIQTNPIISEISFYDVITLVLYSSENIAHAQCTVVILFDFPSFLLQISSKKEPLFKSEQ